MISEVAIKSLEFLIRRVVFGFTNALIIGERVLSLNRLSLKTKGGGGSGDRAGV